VYLDDSFPSHPKLLIAAELLGGGEAGYTRAFTGYVSFLCHARRFGTDGFLSDGALRSMNHQSNATEVAAVFADPRVRFLLRVDGGYWIHDWHQWNYETAADIRKRKEIKRAQNRVRVANWRARQGEKKACG